MSSDNLFKFISLRRPILSVDDGIIIDDKDTIIKNAASSIEKIEEVNNEIEKLRTIRRLENTKLNIYKKFKDLLTRIQEKDKTDITIDLINGQTILSPEELTEEKRKPTFLEYEDDIKNYFNDFQKISQKQNESSSDSGKRIITLLNQFLSTDNIVTAKIKKLALTHPYLKTLLFNYYLLKRKYEKVMNSINIKEYLPLEDDDNKGDSKTDRDPKNNDNLLPSTVIDILLSSSQIFDSIQLQPVEQNTRKLKPITKAGQKGNALIKSMIEEKTKIYDAEIESFKSLIENLNNDKVDFLKLKKEYELKLVGLKKHNLRLDHNSTHTNKSNGRKFLDRLWRSSEKNEAKDISDNPNVADNQVLFSKINTFKGEFFNANKINHLSSKLQFRLNDFVFNNESLELDDIEILINKEIKELELLGNDKQEEKLLFLQDPMLLLVKLENPIIARMELFIGDLIVAKQIFRGYVKDKIAHIETILPFEKKERRHLKRVQSELTNSQREKSFTKSTKDLQSTDRFSLKKEVASLTKKDQNFGASVSASGSFGPVTATASANYSQSTSREESDKTTQESFSEVIEKAQEIIENEFESFVQSVLTEETIDENIHGFNNTSGDEKSGVYYYLSEISKVYLKNYGKRLMINLTVTNPAKFYLETNGPDEFQMEKPEEPALNWKKVTSVYSSDGTNERFEKEEIEFAEKIPHPGAIDEENYLALAGKYKASGIKPPPQKYTYISRSFIKNFNDNQMDNNSTHLFEIKIPESYSLHSFDQNITNSTNNSGKSSLKVLVGEEITIDIFDDTRSINESKRSIKDVGIDMIQDTIPVAVRCRKIRAFALNITFKLKRKESVFTKWQFSTYEAIIAAYQKRLSEYQEELSLWKISSERIKDNNPDVKRALIQKHIKLNCFKTLQPNSTSVNYVVNPFPYPFHIVNSFLERTLDWKNLNYKLNPKWHEGGFNKPNREFRKHKDDDILFEEFLNAGSVEVYIPIKVSEMAAFLYYINYSEIPIGEEINLNRIPINEDFGLNSTMIEELKVIKEEYGNETGQLHSTQNYIVETEETLENEINDPNSNIVGVPYLIKIPTSHVFLDDGEDINNISVRINQILEN